MTIRYLILFFMFSIFVSCQKTAVQDDSPIIMRIGATILTENDVLAAIGTNTSPEQKLNFIQNWSNKELAYQAAIESGLNKNESTKQTIEDMIKNLLSVQFIQQEIEKTGAIEIFADEIENEFRKNMKNYTRKEPVVRVAKIVTATKADAWKAREGLTAANFITRGNYLSLDTILPFEEIKFTPKSSFSPDIFNILFESRTMNITLPIAEDGKYSVYLILEKEDIGSQPPLQEVINHVKSNILAEKQNKIVRNIYENLRNRYDYSYDREYIAKLEKQNKQSVKTEQE